MPIEALILAEGGTGRLRPLTDHVPTSVVPVGGTALLDHQIQVLRSVGVDAITVIGGYRGAQVEQICRSYDAVRFCLNPRFNREAPTLDAVRMAGLVPHAALLVLRGDLLFDPELISVVASDEGGDTLVLDDQQEPLGLWRLAPSTLKLLLDRSTEVDAAEQPLHQVLSRLLEQQGARSVSPNGHPWVRVESLETLARALRVQRQIAAAHVARTAARLEQGGDGERAPFRPSLRRVALGGLPGTAPASERAA